MTMAAIAAAMTSGGIVGQTGQPDATHLEYAHRLISDLPAELKRATIVYHGELTPEYRYLEHHLSNR